MRCVTTIRELRDALKTARRAMSANPSLVAYTGVLIRVIDAKVYVTGSDGETTITARVEGRDLAPGQVLVAPGALGEFLDTFAAAEAVALTLDDAADLIVTVDARTPYTFRALHATFPNPSTSTNKMESATVNGLAAAVAAVKHASSGTVQFVSTDQNLTLNTTDTYRLAQVRLPGAGFGVRDGVALLSAFDEIARHDITHVGVDPKGRELRVRGDSIFISSRLVDEPFPAIDSVLGAIPNQRVEINRREFATALSRLSALAERTPVRLFLEGRQLTCQVSNVDIGAGTETVALGSLVSERFECALQLGYLSDAVNAHSSETITLAYGSPLAPLHLRSETETPIATVVMPVRTTA